MSFDEGGGTMAFMKQSELPSVDICMFPVEENLPQFHDFLLVACSYAILSVEIADMKSVLFIQLRYVLHESYLFTLIHLHCHGAFIS